MEKWICSCGRRNDKHDKKCRKCRKDRPRDSRQLQQDGHKEEIEMQRTEGMDPTE
jgi:ribosomal protein L40E